jgi:hypothetical protein
MARGNKAVKLTPRLALPISQSTQLWTWASRKRVCRANRRKPRRRAMRAAL